MRRINIPYVIWAVLLAALMLTATSCRRAEAVVTEATSAATETETSPSAETAAVSGLTMYTPAEVVPQRPLKLRLMVRRDTAFVAGA